MGRERTLSVRAVLAALMLAAAPLAAQSAPRPAPAAPVPGDTGLVYRREVFGYQAASRPDPFRPLASSAEMGVRLEDLRLTAVVYHPNPRLSVAIFTRGDTSRALRVHSGQRIGNLTIVAIYPRRVDVRVEEFGVSRVESMGLRRDVADAAPPTGPGGDAGAAPAQAAPVPRGQVDPSSPLGRGGRKLPAASAPAARPQGPVTTVSPQTRPPNYP
ncbi:MAG: hypothetical protein JWM27_232 [Gemmatimonadetes bacterium]|nr:hypothetical protein [Gemmatimonadota bacterium]